MSGGESRVIFAGYVCEVVDRCTCAGGGEWPHEAHCGLEPLHLVDELPADDAAPHTYLQRTRLRRATS